MAKLSDQPEDMTEEQKAQFVAEAERLAAEADSSEEDEVGAMIDREEQEQMIAEKERAENEKAEKEANIDRMEREKRDAIKLEEIRQQERDLLDTRSQPIRQYLMDNVVPHLTEGLIELCKVVPEDPTDHLANFLLERADALDEKFI